MAGQNTASLTVTTGAGTSSAVTVNLAAYSPALPKTSGNEGFIVNPNGTLNSSTNPTTPGAVVQIGAGDLGPFAQQQTDGSAPNGTVNITNSLSVTIGGQPATVISAQLCGPNQLCPTADAAYLIAVVVPGISGAAENVVVTEGGAASNTVTMNIGATNLSINSGPSFGDFQMGPVQIPVQASGGTGTGYTWAIPSGLPTGMSLRTDGGPNYFPIGVTTGLIGVATVPGTYTFALQVTDSGNNTVTLQNCNIKILSLAITDPDELPDGLVNSTYPNYQLTLTGITGSVSWAIANGSSLPPGLSLNATSGVISGTPTSPGTYGFSVDATDSTGSAHVYLTIQVFEIGFTNNGDLGIYNQGSTVNITLQGTGGTPPYTFNSGGLAAGLSLNSSTGLISGTITGNFGSYRFSVNINDHNGYNYNKNFVLNIVNVPTAPNLNYPDPIESVTVGESRNYPLNINGGRPPYTWSITSGSLPTGMRLLTGNQPAGFTLPNSLNLGPDDAVITGVPTAAPPGKMTQSVCS